MSKALIVSGFPGVGKSRFTNLIRKNYSIPEQGVPVVTSISASGLKVMDSDSSYFSWSEPGVRNPGFPANYIEHIKKHMDEVDIIFASSHDAVRRALIAEGLEFWLVFPRKESKAEYLKRYENRGSDDEFVQLLDANWDQWIGECEAMMGMPGINLMPLGEGQYLSDWLMDFPNISPKEARVRMIIEQCKDDLDYTVHVIDNPPEFFAASVDRNHSDCHCEKSPTGHHDPDWQSIECGYDKGTYYISVHCIHCGKHADLGTGESLAKIIEW